MGSLFNRSPATPPRTFQVANHPELEAKLVAAPTDEAAWAVYGDWLLSQGDACGELLALTQQGLDADAAEFVTTHAEHLFGALTKSVPKKPKTLNRYAPGALRHVRKVPTSSPALIRELDWDHGFIARASIDAPIDKLAKAEELFALFFRLPVARFVRELGIGVGTGMNDDQMSALLAVLPELVPTTVKRLVASDFIYPDECEMSWAELGDVSPLWRMKQLEALSICGASAELGAVSAEHLVTFSRETTGLPREDLAALLSADWPRLEQLELWLGSADRGGDCAEEDVKPLLEGKAFPKLRHLGLRNTEITDALVQALVGSAILPRLSSLDLSMGTLLDTGFLVKHAAAFAHLKRLDLTDNYLAAADVAAVKAALPMAVGLDEQPKRQDFESELDEEAPPEEQEGLRYCSVSE